MDHQYLEAESALKHLITPEDIVVVAPLNWGLGHATRCIPLIHLLSGYCSKVIIASDGDALSILRAEFPDIEFYVIPRYGIRYKYNNMMYNLLISLPSMISGIVAEGKAAKKIIQKTGANVIISDNRLGFRASGVTNYYMTHQINILYKQTTISKVASMLHQWFIRKFDVCLVPDFENHRSLCPALSHNPGIKKIFIGPLTRISKKQLKPVYDICFLLSGPEPQRTFLEDLLITELADLALSYKIIMIRGTTLKGKKKAPYVDGITVIDLAHSSEIEKILNTSRLLISRSGYSTIMDISRLDIKAIFIPTPGQTEQEYLALRLSEMPKYAVLNQNELNNLQKTIKSLI